VLGRARVATGLAKKVIRLCTSQINQATSDENRFWAYATLGEASLIMGDEPAAENYYRAALSMPQAGVGNVASMRRNVRLILESASRKFSANQSLPLPPVVVFAGHMLDGPGRKARRFPLEAVPQVQAGIRESLAGNSSFCYSSAACGSDILFLEENARNGGQNYIVLPFPAEEFIRTSVEASEGGWEERFRTLLESATKVYVLSSGRSAFPQIEFEFTNSVVVGLGLLKARQLETDLKAVAVWDGAEGELGGTSHAVQLWRRLGIPIQIVSPSRAALQKRKPHARNKKRKGTFTPEIRAMLFADAVGFSRLVEGQIPTFFRDFMGAVGHLARKLARPPLSVNSWGDGLYMVFDSTRSAGVFALRLHKKLLSVDWSSRGLPGDLALRIGLHAGPVYACADSVTGLPTFVGAQVTRAARIEPITPPGSIYVSEQFAALAAAEGVQEFDCEYVGVTPAAKKYGDYPTYVLKSRGI